MALEKPCQNTRWKQFFVVHLYGPMFLSISHPWNPMMNLTSPKCSAIFWWMIPNIPPKRKKNKTKKTSPLLSFRPAEPAKKMVDFCTLIRFMSSGPGSFAEQMSALGKKSRNNKLISNGKKKKRGLKLSDISYCGFLRGKIKVRVDLPSKSWPFFPSFFGRSKNPPTKRDVIFVVFWRCFR